MFYDDRYMYVFFVFMNKIVKISHFIVFAFCLLSSYRVFIFKILPFQLFDGHNGSAAALYSKENLLNNVLSAIPPDLNSDEWTAALPRALVAGFVKTDKEFQERGIIIIIIFCSWLFSRTSI